MGFCCAISLDSSIGRLSFSICVIMSGAVGEVSVPLAAGLGWIGSAGHYTL